MDEMEEIFQHCLNSYSIEEKKIPVEISKKKATLARDVQDYQKAVAENDKSMIRGYQDIIKEDEYELKTFEEKSSFFGTDIFGAKHILESGQISSGVDRLGHATSFDPRGKISATNKDTVDTSVGTYMNLTANFLYPAGCLFVVKPKDKTEYDQLSSTGWMIDNVDFKTNPDRLVAIVTTPENIERVNGWAQKSNIDTAKVMNFEGFIKRCKSRNPKDPRGKMQTPEKYSEIEK